MGVRAGKDTGRTDEDTEARAKQRSPVSDKPGSAVHAPKLWERGVCRAPPDPADRNVQETPDATPATGSAASAAGSPCPLCLQLQRPRHRPGFHPRVVNRNVRICVSWKQNSGHHRVPAAICPLEEEASMPLSRTRRPVRFTRKPNRTGVQRQGAPTPDCGQGRRRLEPRRWEE